MKKFNLQVKIFSLMQIIMKVLWNKFGGRMRKMLLRVAIDANGRGLGGRRFE